MRYVTGLIFSAWMMVLGSTFAQAQNPSLSLEILRTQESPGYFGVRLMVPEGTPPMEIQNIFVRNYSRSEKDRYEPLVSLIRDAGIQLVEADQMVSYRDRTGFRLFTLGDKEDTAFPALVVTKEEEPGMAFEAFALKYITPVYFEDVRYSFGGNVSDVFPERIAYLGADPVMVVGTFRRDLKTLMQVEAIGRQGEVKMRTFLDLDRPALENEARSLMSLWEALQKQETPGKPDSFSKIRQWLLPAFPWLMAFMGLLLIFLSIHRRSRRTDDDSDFVDGATIRPIPDKPSNPAGKIPDSFAPIEEKDLPFSVEDASAKKKNPPKKKGE